MKRVKVLHLISSPHDIGGAESLLLDMSRHVDRDRFEFIYSNMLAAKDTHCKFEIRLDELGLNSSNLHGGSLFDVPFVFRQLLRLLKDQRPDIVHTHLLHATFLGWLASRWDRKVKFVTSHHYTTDIFRNDDIHIARRTALKLGFNAAIRADRVYAVSQAVRDDLIANGCDAQKVEVIHNGIDLERFGSTAARRKSNRAGQKLVTIGSLAERKGHDLLITAFSQVLEEFPNAALTIVGDGDQRDRLTSIAQDLGISGQVAFAGFQSNPSQYLGDADLYVHSARQEPFGIALLEAMAAGLCVVATRTGGAPEIVEDGVTGILVPPNEVAGLTRGMLAAMQNPEKAAAMGEAGRQAVLKFDIKKVVSEYQRSYLDVLKAY